MKLTLTVLVIIVSSRAGTGTACAVDDVDDAGPSDFLQDIQYAGSTAADGSRIEVDGMIEKVTPGSPGWYSIDLKAHNGDRLTLIVFPRTKFWYNFKPLDAALAYKRFVHGQRLRIMHNQVLDAYVKHEMITDMMFVDNK